MIAPDDVVYVLYSGHDVQMFGFDKCDLHHVGLGLIHEDDPRGVKDQLSLIWTDKELAGLGAQSYMSVRGFYVNVVQHVFSVIESLITRDDWAIGVNMNPINGNIADIIDIDSLDFFKSDQLDWSVYHSVITLIYSVLFISDRELKERDVEHLSDLFQRFACSRERLQAIVERVADREPTLFLSDEKLDLIFERHLRALKRSNFSPPTFIMISRCLVDISLDRQRLGEDHTLIRRVLTACHQLDVYEFDGVLREALGLPQHHRPTRIGFGDLSPDAYWQLMGEWGVPGYLPYDDYED
jgi:hypothetical protein